MTRGPESNTYLIYCRASVKNFVLTRVQGGQPHNYENLKGFKNGGVRAQDSLTNLGKGLSALKKKARISARLN